MMRLPLPVKAVLLVLGLPALVFCVHLSAWLGWACLLGAVAAVVRFYVGGPLE